MIFAEQKVQERVPGKTKGAFLLAGWQSKKTLFSFFRLFGYNQFLVIWGLRPRTNSGQVSWLKALRLPPPSRAMAQWLMLLHRGGRLPYHSDEIARD